MKKFYLVLFLVICLLLVNVTYTFANSEDCLMQYQVAYYTILDDYYTAQWNCVKLIFEMWVSFALPGSSLSDALSNFSNVGCGYEALETYYSSMENAANAFSICSGVLITP